MTTAVAKEGNNYLNSVQITRSKNPVDFETKLHYYHSLGLFNENPDFSKIMSVLKKQTAKGLDNLLSSDPVFDKNDKHKSSPDAGGFNANELLNNF